MIKNKTEIEENGLTYIIEKYANGAQVKYLKSTDAPDTPIEIETVKKLSDIDQAILDTAVNIEYLVCLTELGIN